jgi:ABC-2 type transport system permease protein
MRHRMLWTLTVASMKMYFRQKEAIIWTILFPLFVIILFGFVRFDGIRKLDLGVANEGGAEGAAFIARLRDVRTLSVIEGSPDGELAQLAKGERALVLLIPPGFRRDSAQTIVAYADIEARPQETQLGSLVLQRILDEQAFAAAPWAGRIVLDMHPVKTRNLTYLDFLLPGILSMSIMQLGIFGVAFGFVSLKKRGILRRLFATPINPSDFIIAQVATRLVVLILQMSILIGIGTFFLHLHFIGNMALIFLLGILGAIVFLGIGFTLAGISKSEDQVAPLANVITLPMMALSGVFFSRSSLPGFLQSVTGVFPLTYLADGMRAVAIDGATITVVAPQILGLAVWGVITCAVAAKLFRWE